MARRVLALLAGVGLLILGAAPAGAANINSQNAYVVTNLQSDVPGRAAHTDPDLVNGWGITAGPTTPWWVADNGTHKSTLYNGNTGLKVTAVIVNIAGAGGQPADPTGTVFNGVAGDFRLVANDATTTARFIFDGEDGAISGWNGGSASTVKFTSSNGAIYKGLAIGTSNGHQYLYANDFHNNHVDVIDATWTEQHWAGAFVDPGLPAGYAPFGIQNIAGNLFVTYAKQDADAEDEIAGPGFGFVSEFGTDGSFIGRVASGGALNAPWGLAWAPNDWERFGGHLLVGNFGDGRINGFRPTASGWEARGHLKNANHTPLVIDGLWGIGFGNNNGSNNGASGSDHNLYFAAGPDDESHGLFGSISAAP
jgi:uncharacterized protein (TIGR03118 family)